MKKLTIQFAGYGLQDETCIHGFETSVELLNRVAANYLKHTDTHLFDYESGTMWKIVNENEKDKRIAELEAKLEKVQSQYAYECECNKQFVECQKENEKLRNQLAMNAKHFCDKIVKYAPRNEWFNHMNLRNEIQFIVSAELLDQIERGEK